MLEAGSIFARDFRVVRPLRSGGMGTVFLVEQLSTGKLRALKVMAAGLACDPETRQRFVQEARIGARIDSEHVVEVVTAGVEDATSSPYLVMELLRGEDLGDVLERLGPLALGDCAEVFAQMGHALGRAHAQGIVHRDLKPDNVFLSVSRGRANSGQAPPYTVKILDFGVAKLTGGQPMSTRPVGTPSFMAPEQTEAAGEVSPASDVWSLGLMAFAMLTGMPFWKSDGSSLPQLLREVCIDPLPSAERRAYELGASFVLPAGFDAWFARCVDRDPSARFPNAGEAVEAFLALIPETATCEVVVTDAGASTDPVRPRPWGSSPSFPAPPQGHTAQVGASGGAGRFELEIPDLDESPEMELADPDFRDAAIRATYSSSLGGSGSMSPSMGGAELDPSTPPLSAPHPPPRPRTLAAPPRGGRRWLAPATAVGLVLAGAAVVGARQLAHTEGETHTAPAPSASTATAPGSDSTQALQRARACETTRYRMQAGMAPGPGDSTGWVVELWLARAGNGVEPALGLAPGGRLAGSAQTAFATSATAPLIIDGASSADPARSPGWTSATVRLADDAAAYFETEKRAQIIAAASRLAGVVAADAAALYVRCAHLPYHDMPAWVRGSDAPTAAAALTWTVSAHAANAPAGRSWKMDALKKELAKSSEAGLRAALKPAGGEVTAIDGRLDITLPADAGAGSAAAKAIADPQKATPRR
jgi:serine/threonine protein kinase